MADILPRPLRKQVAEQAQAAGVPVATTVL